MIYRSNIVAPDLAPYFAATTICKPRPWSMGHDVMSDAVYEPDCGFMTHDEASILHWCAIRSKGEWLDIGARTGWTTAYIASARHCNVVAVDPMLSNEDFRMRFNSNTWHYAQWIITRAETSDEFFQFLRVHSNPSDKFNGVCIDGNHDAPYPLNDARNAVAHLAETGVIVFHDTYGQPIRDGIEYLMQQGLKCRWYDTPNGMAVCWRGDFQPPDHVPDPRIPWQAVRQSRAPEFNFGACV